MKSLLLLLLPLLYLLPCDAASIQQAAKKGCEYQGKMYAAGARFRPDACSKCHCPRKGGDVKCSVSDCLKEDNCITYVNDTKSCCPKCEEYGCRYTDGRLFSQGEVIRNEPCVRCYCPLGGGEAVCDVTSCPMSECVDPVHVPGVCCPTCPNGPNCQIGLLTLPIGQSVEIDGATCTCEKFVDDQGTSRTLARCNKN